MFCRIVYEKINWQRASWQFATITFVWSADATVLFPANQILLPSLCKGISCSCCWHAEGRPRNSNNSTTSFHLYGHILSPNTPWRQPQHTEPKCEHLLDHFMMWKFSFASHLLGSSTNLYLTKGASSSEIIVVFIHMHLDWSHLAQLSCWHLKLSPWASSGSMKGDRHL